MARTSSTDVDQYIAGFPKDVQATLRAVRQTIRKAVPQAEESISYQIPAYKFHGLLLYFAGFQKHYSVFAATSGVYKAFEKRLSSYASSGKGTIRFPYEEPVPVKLISDMARYRAKENLAREAKKRKP